MAKKRGFRSEEELSRMTELQQRIYHRVEGGNKSITFTEAELDHHMYECVPYIDIEGLLGFDSNRMDIKPHTKEYLYDYDARLFRPGEVAHVTESEDPDLPNGWHIGNGHHRVSMRIALGQTRIRMFVTRDIKTKKDLDLWYVSLNNALEKEKKTRNNIFDVAKRYDGPDAMIYKCLRKYGFTNGEGNANNTIRAIGTLRAIYREYGITVLDKTLYVMFKRFDGCKNSLMAAPIKATAIQIHQATIDHGFSGKRLDEFVTKYIDALNRLSAERMRDETTPLTVEDLSKNLDTFRVEACAKVGKKP